jgi:steroid delta-isomerase-like uncharacterized protein
MRKEETMSTEQNKAAVRRMYEGVHNRGDWAVCDELLAPEFVDHAAPPGNTSRGPESLKQTIGILRGAFPDLHNSVEDMVAEDDKVAFRVTSTGTHRGDFFGLPPTGRSFVQEQVHIVRLADGKFVEHWAARDDLGMMQQLGALPMPGQSH